MSQTDVTGPTNASSNLPIFVCFLSRCSKRATWNSGAFRAKTNIRTYYDYVSSSIIAQEHGQSNSRAERNMYCKMLHSVLFTSLFLPHMLPLTISLLGRACNKYLNRTTLHCSHFLLIILQIANICLFLVNKAIQLQCSFELCSKKCFSCGLRQRSNSHLQLGLPIHTFGTARGCNNIGCRTASKCLNRLWLL